VEEMRLSLWLEDELALYYGSKEAAKKEILSRYASFVYMGNGRYGFAAASAFYFGRPLSSLKRHDAPIGALLAGITKSPAEYAPAPSDSQKALRRRNLILAQMAEDGRIPEANLPRFLSSRVLLASPPSRKTDAPAAIGTVLYEMGRLEKESSLPVGISTLFNGRVGIRTTLDDRLQRIVNVALENGLRRYERRHPGSAGIVQGSAIVLRNRDAAILAEAGGREVYKGRETSYVDYDRVRDSRRQPGSAIKPLVYLAALRKGALTPDSLVADEPISVSMGAFAPPKWIANYDGKFKGMVPARLALAESRNAAAIWVTKQIGIRSVIETARELGIETPLAPYPSTALGGSEVTLLELANVYRAIASGTLARPHAIEEVTDGTGTSLYRWSEPVREIDGGVAFDEIRELLRGVVRIPTGTAHALDQSREFPIPVMGKTGTTNDFRDALFVGSTYGIGGITAAIRIGFDDNRELGEKETGGRTALPIFKEIMLEAYGGGILGPPPATPRAMEDSIDAYLDAPFEMDESATPDAGPLLLGTTIAAVQ
jgi:penicillin-binding protein 1A